MNIFIAKLSSSTSGDDLKTLFEQFGEVTSAKVIFDRETGHSKRYGFVEMPNEEEGQTAINELNETDFQDSQVVVKLAKPKSDNRGGGYGGQRRY